MTGRLRCCWTAKNYFDMKFIKVTKDKKKYLDLLLLADEQEDMVDRYLFQGEMFVLKDQEVIAAAVVVDAGSGMCELKNLAVRPIFQRQGYGRKMVELLCCHYTGQFHGMIVGTGDVPKTVLFYESCGFQRSHVKKNFFTDNYDHPIWEDGILLQDMVYLSKKI